MGTELRGQQEALPQGRHAVVGSAGGLPGPPSQQRLGAQHLAPRMTPQAWHCGLLVGGRPPFQLQELQVFHSAEG